MKTLLLAEWIAPIDRPLIRDGAVLFNARRILAVGPAQELMAHHPDAIIEPLGNALVLPGLINAHTHLELSDLAQLAANGGPPGQASPPRFG